MTSRPRPRSVAPLAFVAALLFLNAPATAQEEEIPGPVSPMPYTIPADWIEPFAGEGFTWGGNSGVHVQSQDRIFVVQRGETRLPDPVPDAYTDFPGSLGWNVLQGERRAWQNLIYVINSDGEVLEVWDHWDHLFTGTDGPGPHRIRISPYDPDNRVWLIDETGHVIYVFSNDGSELLMTLGEKNVPGDDAHHFDQPQDVAFLPDGKVLIGDGLGNSRVVIRDADGRYLSEFGEAGDGPGQFASVHGVAVGPNGDVYVVDRDNTQIEVFRQTNRGESAPYPEYEHKATWDGFGLPLDIQVSDEYAWVTDLRPTKIVQLNLDGERVTSWRLPTEGETRWIEMHSFDVDSAGNVYGTDNQLGRIQKLVPRPDADPEHLIAPDALP